MESEQNGVKTFFYNTEAMQMCIVDFTDDHNLSFLSQAALKFH